MNYRSAIREAADLVGRPAGPVVEVDMATGPAANFAGLRRAIGALVEAGASFGSLPERYPDEWAVLRDEPAAVPQLAAHALVASERRLHRESELAFRVVAAGARAVCHGSEELGTTLFLRRLGRTDLASLAGIVRAVEYGAVTGQGRLRTDPAEAREVDEAPVPAADCRAERARCLRLLGLAAVPEDLRPVPRELPEAPGAAGEWFGRATDPGEPPVARVAAALAYSRAAFFTANWEGMGLVAGQCLPVAEALTRADVAALAAGAVAEQAAAGNQAIEFEPALLRGPADIRAFLLKVLGIQATFRGRHAEALEFFRAIHDTRAPLSEEVRAQAHLYSALVLTKRAQQLDEAVAELDAGFAVLDAAPGDDTSLRRERGWLHNLRGLVLFRRNDLTGALEHERAALDCIDGLGDASAVHLRVNLVSNISVLQESAGKVAQALRTWERFRETGMHGDTMFAKHYHYRAGGLRIGAGDTRGGQADLNVSLRECLCLGDDFHEAEICMELGALRASEGDRTGAGEYFDRSAAAAARLGDPYRMSLAAVGRAAADGRPPGAEAIRLAAASRVLHDRARALVDGCERGGDLRHLLPPPRTKLNRPFDLVAI